MINIDQYMDKTIDFQIGGKLVKVQEPSVKMINKIAKTSNLPENEIIDAQIDLVQEILNNNTSSVKFKKSDIEALPVSAIGKILNVITGAEKDPN